MNQALVLFFAAISFVQAMVTSAADRLPPGYLPATVGSYAFALPIDWTPTKYPDGGVIYASPLVPNGERCQITFFPMRTTSGNLVDDAAGVYRWLFKVDPFTGYPAPPTTLTYGFSPHGW